jgi:hypothetical protein
MATTLRASVLGTVWTMAPLCLELPELLELVEVPDEFPFAVGVKL